MELTGSYTLRMRVTYTDYPDISGKVEFIVRVFNPCQILTPSFNLVE